MAAKTTLKPQIKKKTRESLEILRMLGLPKAQLNERSALTLLSLLDLRPTSTWQEAASPLMGITPMMDFFATHYRKRYAPNSRETVRRFTIHQFEQAGLVIQNPDKPRAINSPDNVYQIESSTLKLLRTYETMDWSRNLATFLESRKTLIEMYSAERSLKRIPVLLPDGRPFELTVGGQNILIKEIIEKFCPYYAPGAEVLYIGDTGDKDALWDKPSLANLGVTVDEHGKMPDVVVYFRRRNWLVLIEAVTSHGPVNPKRHLELKALFGKSKVGLVFVTAFLDRRAMARYLPDISWETEVWTADAPTHMIHFNGERFLGPY